MTTTTTYELAGKTIARIGFGAMQLHGPGGREAPTTKAL